MDNTLKIALWVLLAANILAAGIELTPKSASNSGRAEHHADKFIMAQNYKTAAAAQEACLKLWSLGAQEAQSAIAAIGAKSKAALFKMDPATSWWLVSGSMSESDALARSRQWELSGAGPFRAFFEGGIWRSRSGPFATETEGKLALARLPAEVKLDKAGVALSKTTDSDRFQVRFGPWPMAEGKEMAERMRESGNLKIEPCDVKERQEWESSK